MFEETQSNLLPMDCIALASPLSTHATLSLEEMANLPLKPPRSKLEPHQELIRQLRHKRRTYRETSKLIEERLGFHVAPSTIHSFIKVRAHHRKQVQFELPPPSTSVNATASNDRIATLKAKPVAAASGRERFVFRENEPLTLSRNGGAE